MSAAAFAVRMQAATSARGRLCVGIDPHAALLQQWGLPDSADGLRTFTEVCVAGFGQHASVVKPQVAFFERFGSQGIAVLEEAIRELRAQGVLVIADAKRGDIGSTMAAYSDTWLTDSSPLGSDAVTASPYLGFGSLLPAIDAARASGRGVFVLARTSNPDGAPTQTAVTPQGVMVAQHIADEAASVNASGPACVGLVVGATRDHALTLDELGGPILAPGLGTQGATPADIARIFASVRERVVPAASRAVLTAGPVIEDVADALCRLRDEVETALGTRNG